MNTLESPEKQFEIVKQRFYSYFKKQYLSGVEQATDKVYAKEYFFNELFVENPLAPRFSVFYLSLVSTYSHYVKLGYGNAVLLTLQAVPGMNSLAADALETALLYSTHYENWRTLHWRYLEGIEDHNCSLLELIEVERRLLKASDSKVILVLALYCALEELKIEFMDTSEEREPETEIDLKPKLTRSQQVLVAYYISQALGIKHGKNVSKCADALHVFLNLPYSQITNSELYKKLLNPLTFSSEKATVHNLEVVKAFFTQLGAKQVIEFIDRDIQKLKR